MASPLRLAAVVTLDTSQVGSGVQTTKQAFSSIGTAAETTAVQIQKLVDAQLRIAQPAANTNSRAADIAAYGQELDRLAAKFDPLIAAQQRLQTSLQQINQAQSVGAISASQAIDLRIRETNAYNALASSIASAAAANKAFAQAAVDRVTITPDRGADIAAYGQQLDQLRAKYNPLFAVVTNYKSAVADIREAHKVGAISADEMTAALTRQRRAALGSIDAIKGNNSSGGSDRNSQFRRQNLTYQLFDVGQGIGGGMPLGMVAIQQGPQILQLYAGQGGVNAALKDFSTLAAGVGRFITPVTVGVGALAAALALGGKAWGDYLASTKEVETAASGLGRAVAGTQASMEASAQAGASNAGISVSSARSMEAAFLRTGKIGSENFEKLISISKDFGATIGTDSDAAGQALSQMFADPEKAAQALYQQYGLIDAATARQATNLARQNRQSEAQAVLLDALPGKLASATEATTKLGRAWEIVATNSSNAWDWIGRTVNNAVSGPDLETQRAMAQVRLQDAQGWSLQKLWGGDKAAQTDLDAINAQIKKRDEDAAARQKAANDIRLSQAAVSSADASPANSDSQRIEAYRNSIAAMRSGLNVSGIDDTQRQRITTAIEAQTRALDALINKQARASELDRIDIQIQNERNPAIRAELEARRARLQLGAQEIASTELEASVARERNKVIQETIATAQTQATDMQTETEIRAKLTAQVAAGTITADQAATALQTELQLRPLVLAAAKLEGAEKAALLDTITKLRAAYDGVAEAQRNANAASYLSDQQRNVDRLKFQTSIASRGTTDQSMLLAQYDAEAKIKQMGTDPNGGIAQSIRAAAVETEKWNQQLSRTTDAWNTIRRAQENAIDSGVDKLSSGDFKGALDDVASDAKKTLLQLGVTNPLKNAFTGSNYGTIADVGGLSGAFKQMVGGGQSVASMAVTAGSVVVNGGISAGLGSVVPQAANNNAIGLVSGAASRSTSGTVAAALGSALTFGGNYKGGTDARLTDILSTAALRTPGFGVQAISGYRAGDPRFHGQKLATDVQLTDLASGKMLGNYQDASSFRAYERYAQTARQVQMEKYPELADQFRWGGYFKGGKGKYGAVDTMHFDLAGNKVGMGGGSWAGGLNSQQAALWPGIQSTGMTDAAKAVSKLAASSTEATKGLGQLGTGLGQFGQNLSQNVFPSAPAAGGAGGGLFGWLGGLFSPSPSSILAGSAQARAAVSSGVGGLFSDGGFTGHGGVKEPAGVVHKGEVVWSQADVARAGGVSTVEAMRLGYRGYDRGGVVGGGQTGGNSSSGDSFGKIEVHNYSNANVQAEQTTDERGARQTKFVISDTVGDAMGTKGGGASKTLNRTFGVKRRGISR